jgi:hypothetical protein
MVRAGMRSEHGSPGMGEYYSGRHLEQDLFGKFKASKDYVAAENLLTAEINKRGKGRFVGSNEMRDIIKEHYKDDPTDPKKEFAADVRFEIADQLEFGTDEEMDSLKFYTAVESLYDTMSGVDAWVEVDLGDGKIAEVRLDATLNPNKNSQNAKADLVVRKVPRASHGEDKYLKIVETYGKKIATLLQKRMDAIKAGGDPEYINKKSYAVH